MFVNQFNLDHEWLFGKVIISCHFNECKLMSCREKV